MLRNKIKIFFSGSLILFNVAAFSQVITGFSPASITAGTGSVLTINGTGFGTGPDFFNYVAFAKADDGGNSFMQQSDLSAYISWTNTQILVKVPSGAGTGIIKVVKSGTEVTSAGSLTISYNLLNAVNNSVNYPVKLVNNNATGGYTFRLQTDFNANVPVKDAFMRAFNNWECNTKINWSIGSVTTVNTTSNTDGVNVIRFDVGNELDAGYLAVTYSTYQTCDITTGRWEVVSIDMVFDGVGDRNWNFGPALPGTSQYDFESVALHELGHAHTLGHSNDNTDVMYWASSPGSTQRTLNSADLAAANYALGISTASVGSGCSLYSPMIAISNVYPAVSIAASSVSICAGSTTTFTATPANGGTAPSYQWKRNGSIVGGNAPQYSSSTLATGDIISCVLTSNASCVSTLVATSNPLTVTINPLPSVVVTNPLAVCAPLTVDITSPSITTAGSTSGLSYTYWNNALATSVLSNANAITATGLYYIKGTVPATGCAVVQPVTATINPLPTVVVINPSSVCAPQTVDLTSPLITSAGSTTGLSYTYWNNALATSPLTNANAITSTGVYYIKATISLTGCAVIKPVSATINTGGVLPTVVITNPAAVCAPSTVDLTSSSITSAGSTSALSYTYWNNALATSVLANANAITATGVYYIKGTVPLTGCAIVQPVTATINPLPTVLITNPAALCTPLGIDLTNPAIISGSTPGLSYSYWNNALATSPITPAGAMTLTASGVYYIKGTLPVTGCAVVQPVTVTINPSPILIITNPSPVCSPITVDLTKPSIISGGTAGLSYTYWNNALATSPLINPGAVNASGVYYIKGTIPLTGCTITMPVTVTIYTGSAFPTVVVTNPLPVCAPLTVDLTNPAITSSGSTAGLSYTYWNNNLSTSSLANASAITATGIYYVKGTLPATGCSVIQPVTAIINQPPTVVITNPLPACAPQTIDLTSSAITMPPSTPGLSYTYWYDALATTSLTNASAITITGVYYIKGTSIITGCSVIKPVTATINPLPVVNITNPLPVCAPLTVDITASAITSAGSTAGLSYTYFYDGVLLQPLTNAGSLTGSGVYYIKGVVPSTGCSAIKPVTVKVNPQPVVNIINPEPLCAPLTIDLTNPSITSLGSTIGLSYTYWNNALATSPLTNANAVTVTGVYYIKGTIPATGCAAIQSVPATINPLPILIVANPSVCLPGTIDLTSPSIISAGSTAGLSYTYWNNALATSPVTPASAMTITASGVYYIKATLPITGCAVIQPVTATINPLPTVVVTNPSAVCSPSTIDLTSPSITSVGSTAGLSYTYWYNALATSAIINANAITATGTYYIKGTIPTTGCGVVQPLTVTINASPVVPAITGVSPVCVNASITLNNSVTGGVWASSDATKASISSVGVVNGVSAGTVTITYTVTNANGCTTVVSTSVIVNAVPPKPTITIAATNLLSSSASGNQWYNSAGIINGATAQTYKPSVDGYYKVQATISGCTSAFSDPFYYLVTAIANISLVNGGSYQILPNPVSDLLIIRAKNLVNKITAQIIGLDGKVAITKTFTNNTTISMQRLAAGTYSILLTDLNTKAQESKMIIKQ